MSSARAIAAATNGVPFFNDDHLEGHLDILNQLVIDAEVEVVHIAAPVAGGGADTVGPAGVGIILFLISASSAMSFVMAYSGIPAAISEGIMSISTNKYVILLLMNIILMVVGMFMDITPAILIFTPIFLPIAQSLGMTDIQFGVMLIFNMCLGNITPPVGSVLFVGCGISKISIEQVTKTLLPYFAVLFLLLLAVTYIPALSLGVPSLMGLI